MYQDIGNGPDQIGLGVKEIELELTLELGKRTSGGGGVNVAFLKGDADTERSGAHTHHIRLVLQPGVPNKDTGEVESMKLSGVKRPAAVPHQPGP
ncbi:trypco2 family protein [Glycomyces tarimensis]